MTVSWRRDAALRRLLRNAATLSVGGVGAAIGTFLAVAVATRALGVAAFGMLVLVQTYVYAVDKLVNFQSWQAVIKYGTEALARDDGTAVRRLVKAGTLLDAGAALVGTAIAVAVLPWAAQWLDWPPAVRGLALVYCAAIAFNATGTATGVLRVFNRFSALAAQQSVTAALRLAGGLVAAAADAGLTGFVAAWLAAEVAGAAVLIALAWRELARQGVTGIWAVPLRGLRAEYPGVTRFVWTTNLYGSVKMSVKNLDTLVVGAVLGTSAAGLYSVARQLTALLGKGTDVFYQAIYPDLARLWAAGHQEAFVRLAARAGTLAGGVALGLGVGYVVGGRWLLETAFGPSFAGAYAVMLWYYAGVALLTLMFPMQPVLLSMGRPTASFVAVGASAAAYFAAVGPLLHHAGLAGAGMAYVLFCAVLSVLMGGQAVAGLRERRRVAVGASVPP